MVPLSPVVSEKACFCQSLKFGPAWPILKWPFRNSNQFVVFIFQTMSEQIIKWFGWKDLNENK